MRRVHDDALKLQKEADLKRHQIEHEKNIENAKEQYIVACDFFDRYDSERCWKTEEEAWIVFNQLKSESARLKAVKEQIMIRTKGFGWDDAGHAWSKNGNAYSSDELMNHFIETVLPMEQERGIPKQPPIKFQEHSERPTLGTKSNLNIEHPDMNATTLENMRENAIEERERRMEEGEMDIDTNRQTLIMPKVDTSLVGFNIEYCFTYFDDDGSTYDAWCDGIVEKVINEKTRMVLIRWNEKKVHEGDQLVSRHKLGIRSWNPKNPKGGAWREYLGNPDE